MPLLDNPRYETFAQELAKGATQEEAYKTGGYKPSRSHASRLVTNGNVRDRVAEIMSAAAERAEISIASVTENLMRIAQKAEQLRDASGLSVARNAWMDAAKVNGLIIDKAEHTNRTVDPNSLSDAEIVAIIEAGAGRQSCTEAERRLGAERSLNSSMLHGNFWCNPWNGAVAILMPMATAYATLGWTRPRSTG